MLKFSKKIKSHNQVTVIDIEVHDDGKVVLHSDGDKESTECGGIIGLDSSIRIYELNIEKRHKEISDRQQPIINLLTTKGFKKAED